MRTATASKTAGLPTQKNGKSRPPVIPNAERRASTRRAVLEAAGASFDENGYLATRLDDIVARTTMTKGAVYFHFASKEDLARALVTAYFERVEEMARETADDADGFDAIVGLTGAVARAVRDSATLRAGARLAVERHLIDSDLPDPFDWWVTTLTPLVRRAQKGGRLTELAAAPTTARVIATFLLGAQHVAGDQHDLQRRLQEFWQFMKAVEGNGLRSCSVGRCEVGA
jgi:AcrR family transcriptional regulator